jgi:Na+/H+ antiporter NhaD/arsenite permease-like protein
MAPLLGDACAFAIERSRCAAQLSPRATPMINCFLLASATPAAEPHPLIMLPFAAILLCIALLPFILKHRWEENYHLVALGLSSITIGYYAFVLKNPARMLHEAGDYLSFMALVGSLFVVSGGIHLAFRGEAKPILNCLFLLCGGLFANVVGTTGASMLLIRPWIRVNKYRYTGFHTAFFIFIISNAGGGLTPIGDPPLFLGYLKGVPFWWVIQHCWQPWLVAFGTMLVIFYLIDKQNFRRAPVEIRHRSDGSERVQFLGLRNVWFLLLILAAVFVNQPPFLREAMMIVAAIASYLATPKELHQVNCFTFAPLKEVAWLFFGIFATMVPVLDYMRVHADKVRIDTPRQYFWLTGGLSSVLDNAPTYLTFFANALGRNGLSLESKTDVARFLSTHGNMLVAISMGAVLFGAVTYIGNGPNFMVKAIATEQKVAAPGFFAYLLKYALPVLFPIFLLISFLFF